MTSLAQYDRARAALAEATRIDEVVPLIDEVENVRRFAKQINDQALLADATEFQWRAERKLGFVIAEAKKAGHFAKGPRKKVSDIGSGYEEPIPATLEEAGVSKKLSSRAQKRASISERAMESVIAGMRQRIAEESAVPVNGARAMAPGRKEPSASLDFSPTPPWATRALFEHVLPAMLVSGSSLKSAHEPAEGEGHISEVLCEYFPRVTASDIHDYGTGAKIEDFLADDTVVDADWIITNPPFRDLAEQFALRAIERARVGVAIFARLQWLETIGRYERLFRTHPPTQLAFFAERVNLCMGRWEPDGGTATAYIWLVWMKDRKPRAPFWIPPVCKATLTRPDDEERFTAHPVIRKEHVVCDESFDAQTGEISEAPDTTLPPLPSPSPFSIRSGGGVMRPKALSILQPWPWAIIHLGKDVENRTWMTGYRGRFLIHASKGFDEEGYAFIREVLPSLPVQVTLPKPHEFQRGGIVGSAVIRDVVKASDSQWFFGPVGFVLQGARAEKFTPCRGQLGFFEAPVLASLDAETIYAGEG